jgi:hypothetical protein
METYMLELETRVEQVNAICMRLFDTWCESRDVTSLAYLMHCWPMIDATPNALRRLGDTMRDLRRYHGEQLNKWTFQALCDMADLIDELIEHRARTMRRMVAGRNVVKSACTELMPPLHRLPTGP